MGDLSDFDGLLNWDNLLAWIEAEGGIPGKGPVTEVEKLTGGSQNNLFLMTRGGERFVLRRPPAHVRRSVAAVAGQVGQQLTGQRCGIAVVTRDEVADTVLGVHLGTAKGLGVHDLAPLRNLGA